MRLFNLFGSLRCKSLLALHPQRVRPVRGMCSVCSGRASLHEGRPTGRPEARPAKPLPGPSGPGNQEGHLARESSGTWGGASVAPGETSRLRLRDKKPRPSLACEVPHGNGASSHCLLPLFPAEAHLVPSNAVTPTSTPQHLNCSGTKPRLTFISETIARELANLCKISFSSSLGAFHSAGFPGPSQRFILNPFQPLGVQS